VSYADGSIVIYDKEREDGTFTPQVPRSTANLAASATPGEWDPNEEMFVSMPPWHPASPAPNRDGAGKNDKTGKNPISHWKLSKMSVLSKDADIRVARRFSPGTQSLDFVFSPDIRYVAAVSEDGCLRIIDTLSERYCLFFFLNWIRCS
jgi:WD40 repeat protein